MDPHLRRREVEQLGEHGLVVGLALRAVPGLAAIRGQADHTVHRLHRRVREIGKVVLGLQRMGGLRQRHIAVALLTRHLPRRPGQLAIVLEQLRRVLVEGGCFVPLDHQRIAAALGAPGIPREHRDPAGDLHHLDHPVDRQRWFGIVCLDGGAEPGGMGDHGSEHARQLDVLGKDRLAGDLVVRVLARDMPADQPELTGFLEPDLLGHRLLRRGPGQLAEGCLPAGSRMADHTASHRDVVRRHLPLGCGRRDQHGTRRGTGLAQLLPGVGDRGTAAGALRRAPEQVVVARGIGGCALHPHLRPVRIQLLGQDGGQTGIGALAHFQVLGDDGDAVVLADAQEGVGLERLGLLLADRPLRQRPGEVDGQSQASGPLEKTPTTLVDDGPAHVQLPARKASDLAASWIAARMRT
ncbi:hypothetical protein D9M71_313450 [compost metagenome]